MLRIHLFSIFSIKAPRALNGEHTDIRVRCTIMFTVLLIQAKVNYNTKLCSYHSHFYVAIYFTWSRSCWCVIWPVTGGVNNCVTWRCWCWCRASITVLVKVWDRVDIGLVKYRRQILKTTTKTESIILKRFRDCLLYTTKDTNCVLLNKIKYGCYFYLLCKFK